MGPSLAIHQPEEVLGGMNAWCVEHHGKSGLTERCRESEVSLAEAEARVLGQLVARNAAQHRGSRHAARLAGVGRALAELARAQAAQLRE